MNEFSSSLADVRNNSSCAMNNAYYLEVVILYETPNIYANIYRRIILPILHYVESARSSVF
jgi:hypothetical protein